VGGDGLSGGSGVAPPSSAVVACVSPAHLGPHPFAFLPSFYLELAVDRHGQGYGTGSHAAENLSRHSERFEEFCGDSRPRLSGRASGRLYPCTENSVPEVTAISSTEGTAFIATAQAKIVALRATDSRRQLSPHNLAIRYFSSVQVMPFSNLTLPNSSSRARRRCSRRSRDCPRRTP
jgi:hypothetical protein